MQNVSTLHLYERFLFFSTLLSGQSRAQVVLELPTCLISQKDGGCIQGSLQVRHAQRNEGVVSLEE